MSTGVACSISAMYSDYPSSARNFPTPQVHCSARICRDKDCIYEGRIRPVAMSKSAPVAMMYVVAYHLEIEQHVVLLPIFQSFGTYHVWEQKKSLLLGLNILIDFGFDGRLC